MFQQANYEQIVLSMPTQGMNKFISPNKLSDKFAFHLENILPYPLGVGQVRFGDNEINKFDSPLISIIEAFPFVNQNGSIQEVLYVQNYIIDNTIDESSIEIQDFRNISFFSEESSKYIKNTYLRIVYSINGANYTFYPRIGGIFIVGDVVDITLDDAFFPHDISDVQIENISYPVGQIYAYDYTENEFSNRLYNNLSVACIPRYCIFNQTMLICNGVDKLLYYDGQVVDEVYDYVKETKADNFVRNDNDEFQFTSLNGFILNKYFQGNIIQLSINGNPPVNLTLSQDATQDGTTITVNTLEEVPEFGAEDIVELFYKDWPPAFSYLYPYKNRIFALGPGAAGIEWRQPNETMTIYFPYLEDSIFGWFNENSKVVPMIDVSNKHGIQDNLEAICQVNGLLALVGRTRTQVWSGGAIPPIGLGFERAVDFKFEALLDVGIVNGNLLINMPNDVYFISSSGLKSFGTLNIAKQFAATSENAIDPIIEEYLVNIMSSEVSYRACRSFIYNSGKFCGFKFGDNKLLVSLFDTRPYAWTFFSGDFQKSSAFCDSGNFLSLFIGGTIYHYADGSNSEKITYGDKNGTSLISFSWIPGLVNRGSRGFANKRYQLKLSYPSAFPLNEQNIINITVYGESPSNFRKIEAIKLEEKGDFLGGAPLMEVQNYEQGYFKLSTDYSFLIRRFKFACFNFWVMLNGYTMDGPIFLDELILFGGKERNG